MTKEEKHVHSLIVVCCTMVLLAIIGFVFQDCQNRKDAKLSCIKAGRTPQECQAAFGISHD